MVYVNSKLAISRFHWNIATVWFDSIFIEDKPNVAPIRGFHTPIIQSRRYDCFLAISTKDLIESINLSTEYVLFQNVLLKDPDRMFSNGPILYDNIITADPVPRKFVFDLERINGMVIIGTFDSEKLPIQLKEKMHIR